MNNKKIIVTGASRGIGFELVKLLASQHQVLALSRNTSPLINLQATNKNISVLPLDISDERYMKKLFSL